MGRVFALHSSGFRIGLSRTAWRPLLAGLALATAVWNLRETVPFVGSVIANVFGYSVCFFATGGWKLVGLLGAQRGATTSAALKQSD